MAAIASNTPTGITSSATATYTPITGASSSISSLTSPPSYPVPSSSTYISSASSYPQSDSRYNSASSSSSLSGNVTSSPSSPLPSSSSSWTSSVWSTYVSDTNNTNNPNGTTSDTDQFSLASKRLPSWMSGMIAVSVLALFGFIGVFVWRRRRARRRQLANGDRDGHLDMVETSAGEGVPRITRADILEITPPALPPRPVLPRLETVAARTRTRTSSAWEDSSEVDVYAIAGSSIARTISNTSDPEDGMNPFDHPAYTLPAYRREPPQPSHRSLLTSPTTSTHPQGPSPSSSGGRSPLVLDVFGQHHMNDNYVPRSPTVSSTLSRETTIIRHLDSQGGTGEDYRVVRGRGREVHLPPTYIEVYPGLGDDTTTRTA